MNIVVCVKQTPKSENVKIDAATGCLIRSGSDSAMNPFDTYALETAVTLKEQEGGTVCAITMGPPQAQAVLRESVARGADKVYQLGDPSFAGSDTWATSYALAKGIEKINSSEKIDLVICGKQTNDSDTGHVGPQISAWLQWPNVAFVKKIRHINQKSIVVERLAEDGNEVLEIPFPCVISVVKEISNPRVCSVKGRLAAKHANITTWTAEDIGADKNKMGVANSLTKVVKSFVPNHSREACVVSGENGKEKGANLIAILKENNYI